MQPRISSPFRISQQDDLRRDFRLMVEGVQNDDLVMANRAFSRIEFRESPNSECHDALSRIGISLNRGDLGAARESLEVLEARALQVLRGLRERTQTPSALRL